MFEAVKGQKIAKSMLENEIASGRLPQVLLFYGPDGSGKFLTAMELIKILCCQDSKTSFCNCASCRAVQNLQSRNLLLISQSQLQNTFSLWQQYGIGKDDTRDFVRDVKRLLTSIWGEQKFKKEYDALQNMIRVPENVSEKFSDIMDLVFELLTGRLNGIIGIDAIRKIQRFLSLKSGESAFRSVILDGAEYMNVEAANSFLKISEDTPSGAIIILVTVKKSAIRETILSRCRHYRFVPLSNEEKRDIVEERRRRSKFDSRVPQTSAEGSLEKYYKKMISKGNDLFAQTKIISEIVENGQAAHFLDFMMDALTGEIPKLNVENMNEICEVEELLKRLEFLKTSLISHYVNVDTIMTDFLLNNYSKIIHYTKERH